MGYVVGEVFIALAVLAIFCIKIANYADPGAFRPAVIAQAVSGTVQNTVSAISNLPFLNSCPGMLKMADVAGGYVCISPSATGPYAAIYRTYPLVGSGREDIYTSTDEGSAQCSQRADAQRL